MATKVVKLIESTKKISRTTKNVGVDEKTPEKSVENREHQGSR